MAKSSRFSKKDAQTGTDPVCEEAPDAEAFTSVLKALVSVSRTEMQRRLDSALPEKTLRHKRYKYVHAERRDKG